MRNTTLAGLQLSKRTQAKTSLLKLVSSPTPHPQSKTFNRKPQLKLILGQFGYQRLGSNRRSPADTGTPRTSCPRTCFTVLCAASKD